MTVLVEDDSVLVVAPPGSCAVLSAAQTRRLGAALEQAAGAGTAHGRRAG